MALRLREASSSDCPPDKKVTPTKAGTAVLDKATTVLVAISSGVMLGLLAFLDPAVTMLGFKRHPSKKIPWSYKALNTTESTFSVTFWECSMEWVPSTKISGSTIGTSPFS